MHKLESLNCKNSIFLCPSYFPLLSDRMQLMHLYSLQLVAGFHPFFLPSNSSSTFHYFLHSLSFFHSVKDYKCRSREVCIVLVDACWDGNSCGGPEPWCGTEEQCRRMDGLPLNGLHDLPPELGADVGSLSGMKLQCIPKEILCVDNEYMKKKSISKVCLNGGTCIWKEVFQSN